MVTSEEHLEAIVAPGAVPDDMPLPFTEDEGPSRPSLAVGLAASLLGLVLVVTGTAVLTDSSAVLRLVVTLAGIAGAAVGVDRLATRALGPQVNVSVWFAVLWLTVLVAAALLADLLPFAEARNVQLTLTEPTLVRPDLFSAHPLGTDRQGLDILGGVVYGARVSLVVGVVATLLGMTIGGFIGLCAGYYGRWTARVADTFGDSLLAFPPLVLLLAMVAVFRPNITSVTAALTVLSIPSYIRLARANTLVHAQREFVLVARALGARKRTVLWREIVPNVLLPVVSYAFVIFAVLVVAEASLSFLGLGIQRPNPTWGNMIAAGAGDFDRHPHLVFGPGIVLFLTVFAINVVGDRLRRAWDPRRGKL